MAWLFVVFTFYGIIYVVDSSSNCLYYFLSYRFSYLSTQIHKGEL